MKKMRVEKKSETKSSVLRLAVVLVSLSFHIIWAFWLLRFLEDGRPWVNVVYGVITVILALLVYGRHMNASYKLPWIILILGLPPMGMMLYLFFGRKGALSKQKSEYRGLDEALSEVYPVNAKVIQEVDKDDPYIGSFMKYIIYQGGFSVWKHTRTEFYNDGAVGAAAQIEELKKAEKYIFMEYHAVEDGVGFEPFKQVLMEKARAGVEVRLIFDDIGSIMFIDKSFSKELESAGVQVRDFNPVSPIIHVFMNYRDHRKITVIDGKVGFVGGYNLANEYFHITEPYGFWKDSGVKITGDAVKSLVLIFMGMWNYIKLTDSGEDGEKYTAVSCEDIEDDGYVLPYADSPMLQEPLAETVYMNMLRTAKKYCWFTTPYLIITDEMSREIVDAAKRGVDVRIITPGIPDKRLVYSETRSYYAQLARDGVRIFEYTPGFCHSKMCIADDVSAIVGTINLDFRSLYLHFENGIYFYKSKVIKDIKKDFNDMYAVSREVTDKYDHRNLSLRIRQCLLRLVSPLM
ncbi:cardiolipin synthase [Lachnospiraceae bacterium KH1T2]|nr:cardiolipin synthase [Lachnospiraceae bacterium KH1T2]